MRLALLNPCLSFLVSENDISVRAEADGALRALSSRLDSAKRSLVDADGFPVFISTIQVPSKEFSCGVVAKKFKCRTEQRDFLLHMIEIHPVFDFWVSLCFFFWWFRRARVCAH
jgi:hypothetical protein